MAPGAPNDGFDAGEEKQTLRLFGSHEAAAIAAAKLTAHGIPCWVDSDDCAGWYSNLTPATGVRLKVRAADAGAAEALLDSQLTPAELNQLETEALAAAPEPKTPLKKLAWIQILIGIGIGVYLCLFITGQNQMGNRSFYYYTSDGKCYEAATYRNGHIVTLCRDRNLDGKWDNWVHYYQGHVSKVEYDNNFDGAADEFVIYSNGLPVTAKIDTDFNGIPDLFCTYTNGMIQQIDVRPNGSTITLTREIYKHGVLSEVWRGGDSNGFFDVVEQYDAFYNPKGTKNPAGFRLLSPDAK